MTFYGSVSVANSVDCITNFRGKVIHSKMGSTVLGTFYHDDRYKYTCPDIKVTYGQDKTDNHADSTIAAGPVAARMWKPQPDDFVVAAIPAAVPNTAAVAAVPAPTAVPIVADKKKIETSFGERKAIVNQGLPGGIRFGSTQLL